MAQPPPRQIPSNAGARASRPHAATVAQRSTQAHPAHPATVIHRPAPHAAKLGPGARADTAQRMEIDLVEEKKKKKTKITPEFKPKVQGPKSKSKVSLKRKSTAWAQDVFYEDANETAILALRLGKKAEVQKYLAAKSNLSDVRHKISWEYFKLAVEWALKNKSITPLNNVLVLAGRFDLPRVDSWDEFSEDQEDMLAWINESANGPPNIFWGDAGVNRSLGEVPDLHSWHDPFGLNPSKKIPKTPVSKSIFDFAPKLGNYIAGHVGFNGDEVEALHKGVVKHYKGLVAEADKLVKSGDLSASVLAFLQTRYDEMKKPHDSWMDSSSWSGDDFMDTSTEV